MRIAAIGDAHLGRSYYPYTTEGGVNQREFDFERSFEAAVELALHQQPDLIVWLGDIFDHPRPSYRSFRVAQSALVRIREHGARIALITGNHDTPRLPGKGSPYSVLADTFPEMHFAHRLAYERFDLPGLTIHAVPQTLTVDAALDALAEAARQRRPGVTNLLLTHPRITQLQPRYSDINEIEVDAGLLQSDLVLLGHYHTFAQVSEGMWYAGAPDSFSFADDPDRPKGIAVLDTDTGECRHVPLPGRRPMVTLESVYALGLSPTELQERLLDRASAAPEGAVARLYVEGVDPEVWRLLDHLAIRDAAAAGLHLKLEPSFVAAAMHAELPTVSGLGAQWDSYVGGQDLTGLDRDRVRLLGHEYLDRAITGSDGGGGSGSC
ncbi:MAG TPA: metallophosphoesterase [Acidimicrobiales bacterium]|nr:metallophosphoesterase [Acidimicrobiales bacterium]